MISDIFWYSSPSSVLITIIYLKNDRLPSHNLMIEFSSKLFHSGSCAYFLHAIMKNGIPNVSNCNCDGKDELIAQIALIRYFVLINHSCEYAS